VFIIFFLGLIESLLRNESDLDEADIYCGTLVDYFYDEKKIQGFSTWRAVVSKENERYKSRIFLVGSPYITQSDALNIEDKGKIICVEYLKDILPFKEPFITQIHVSGNAKLKPNTVKAEYLSPPKTLDKVMSALMLLIVTILFFKKRRV